jgi:sugar diacid utilization regulator
VEPRGDDQAVTCREWGLNVLGTARALNVHPNTLYARMGRITTITALEPRSFGGLTELLTVVACREAAGSGRG